jgi:hypothetical protein
LTRGGRAAFSESTGEQTLITAAFGLTGALVAFSGMRIKTFVRVQTAEDFYPDEGK